MSNSITSERRGFSMDERRASSPTPRLRAASSAFTVRYNNNSLPKSAFTSYDAEKLESDPPNTESDSNWSANAANVEDLSARAVLASPEKLAISRREHKAKNLSWRKLYICLIVEAIALGSLSLPSAFATLGLVAGIIETVGIGAICIYTGLINGQVFLKHREIRHYGDAIAKVFGTSRYARQGYWIGVTMFVVMLTLILGAHVLTGTVALISIIEHMQTCALVWGIVSAIILFALAIPPTFHEFTPLGFIDFISIIAAIIITMVATGHNAITSSGGLSAVNWSLWPPQSTTFTTAFLATTHIIFAYSFAVCQFSFMAEMREPKDYPKAIWALGITEICIYTIVGSVVYVFVGQDVQSPALLSAGNLISRIAFGVALPVIFISGSINTTVVGRFILDQAFPHNAKIKYVEGCAGWAIWLVLLAVITLIAWVVAEAIPFFNELLGLISSLLISGFSFYFPAIFWFGILKEGKWNASRGNVMLSIMNAGVLLVGIVVLVGGTYASVVKINEKYTAGEVRASFTCDSRAYASH